MKKGKGCLIVVSGPSGAGKGTVCAELLARYPEIAYSVSATTRPPRDGEREGADYYFLDKQSFEHMIEDGELLEWVEVFGHYYGTPLRKIQEQLAAGRDILLEIETKGAMNVKKRFPNGIFVFLLPPTLAELERRIRGRGSDDEAAIRSRLESSAGEIAMAKEYRYVVVNEDVNRSVDTIWAILTAERCRSSRNTELIDTLSGKRK